MNKKAGILVTLFVIAGLMIAGNAGAALVDNGNFETGDITDWYCVGNCGAANYNVITGSYSGYVSNNGLVCSFLVSNSVYPAYYPVTVTAKFKVRYKTDEATGANVYWTDPFIANLHTGKGTIALTNMGPNGVTAAPGTIITNLSSGLALPAAPTLLPFFMGTYFSWETPTLEVKNTFKYSMCDPIFYEFMMCNTVDTDVESAAFLDDVEITPVYSTNNWGTGGGQTPCPPAAGGQIVPER